jgi:hypothetical protein
MGSSMKRTIISAIVMFLGLSSIGYGQKEFINMNGKKRREY